MIQTGGPQSVSLATGIRRQWEKKQRTVRSTALDTALSRQCELQRKNLRMKDIAGFVYQVLSDRLMFEMHADSCKMKPKVEREGMEKFR